MTSLKSRPGYKWVILCISFLMVFVCLGFCSSNKGMYLSAITEALDLKRSLFSVNDSFRYVALAVLNLFFGTLIKRFGARKMTAFGFAALIASTLIYAYARSMVAFYIGGTLLGVGLAFTSNTMASCIVRRWFKTNLGKYMGIVFSANGIGGAVAAQIASPLINQPGNPFGYRTSYLVVAGILSVVGALTVLLLREQPEDSQPDAQTKKDTKADAALWKGITYKTAQKRGWFYFTAAVVLLNGFMLQGISGVYAAHMKDVGMDAGYIATMVSTFSLALTVSKLLVGAVYDRRGLSVIMLMCQLGAVAAFLLMTALDASALGKGLAVAFVLFYALSLPLETLVIPLIANELFGTAEYERFVGLFSAMNYTGYALSAPLINLCYDIWGTYNYVLWVFGGLMLICTAVFQFVIRAARKERTQ